VWTKPDERTTQPLSYRSGEIAPPSGCHWCLAPALATASVVAEVRCKFGGNVGSPLIRFENLHLPLRFGGVQIRDRFAGRAATQLPSKE
jgi:hypothetical protein